MTWFVHFVYILCAAVCGAIAAWFVLRRHLKIKTEANDHQARFARETLVKLQELTSKVAADVDRHSSAVREINAQLANTDDEAAVLAAVAQFIEVNRRMQERLETAEHRLQVQARQMESHAVDARADALTQVANRRALDDEIRRCLADFTSRGMVSTLMLVDVDHFKKFNDTHGHQAGDEVLRGVARVLRSKMGEMGLVARYGGEEFAVIFAGLALPDVVAHAERARQAIAETSFRSGGKELFVTVSTGLAEIQSGDQENELIHRADEALYTSKNAGRNCGHYNDGAANLPIELTPIGVLPSELPVEPVGDEWLFESETSAESLYHEPLARVSNRPAFFDDMIRRLSQWRRGGAPLALMLVQIDDFGRLVAEHSATAGEGLLLIAAKLVNSGIRDMDHLARLGEDTFAILMPGAHLSHAVAIAQRLRSTCERCRLPPTAGPREFTISVGVVEASEGDDLRQILERARNALHAAVRQGRNRVCGHDRLGCTVKEPEPELAVP
jgi:diguanylate cyclase